MMRETIEDKLRAEFEPLYLEVIDESHRHNVPAGSGSHFKVIIVSERFVRERALGRHRAIYAALAAELASSLHALALHAYSASEWDSLQHPVPSSPPCGGAGIMS
ncbi:transcriptional regulator BolA [Brenneria sp. 4F2]|nr:transcriptional regulator BolA [Brenneria bubanii]